MEAFAQAALEKGCVFPRVELCTDIEGFGGGVRATKDIPDGYDALVVPLDELINVETIHVASPGLFALLKSFHLSDYEIVYAFLVSERQKSGASRWDWYFRILPDRNELKVPLLCSEDELKCIKGTNMMREIIKIRKSMRQLSEKLAVAAQARPDLVGPGGFSVADLTWAFAIFASRALNVLWKDGKTHMGSLVPLADMLNHCGGAHVEYLTHPNENAFSIRCKEGVANGKQVFLNYGVRAEEKMLLNYGFTEQGTPFFVQALQINAGIAADDSLHAERTELLTKYNLTLEMYITENDIENALRTCRILTAISPDEIEMLRRDNCDFAMLRNECDALEALQGQLEETLARFAIVEENDEIALTPLHAQLLSYARSQRHLAQQALVRLTELLEMHIPPDFEFDDDEEEEQEEDVIA